MSMTPEWEQYREAFEEDARALGFDLRRATFEGSEPWTEYVDDRTGYRWSGWIAVASQRTTEPEISSRRLTQNLRSQEMKELILAAIDANDFCRSAFMWANRIATEYSSHELGTAFGPFADQIYKSLERQHGALKKFHDEKARVVLAGGTYDGSPVPK